MTDRVHSIVIGAGVVGLAVARRLARDNGELLVIERGAAIGGETSSRNSEVIHAGMYYAAGSLKARSCVAGRRLLYDYCRDRGIEHRRVGKFIVATSVAELDALEAIAARARVNGLVDADDGLRRVDGSTAMAMEPGLQCIGALHSPATGIVDTHGLMLAYLADAESEGAMLVTGTEFVGAERDGDGWRVRTRSADGEFELLCRQLVNCGGLFAQRAAARIEGLPPAQVPAPRWLKGNYFSVQGRRPPFGRLIYPVPGGGGLGVHMTLDLGGQARFGPDTEPVPLPGPDSEPDYRVDPARADVFYEAIRRYWPELPDGSLVPAYAGMRPKLLDAGEDFVLSGPQAHGLPGLLNLFGIESPGITASLALADFAASALRAD